MTDRPTIYIRQDGDAFAVTVEPAQPDQDWSRTYSTHREARGWAGGIRLNRGWKLVDLASDAALSDVLGMRRERRLA